MHHIWWYFQYLIYYFCTLRSGQNVQKINAVENLKSLLSERQADTLQKFLPCIAESLQSGTDELHIVTSRVFCDVADSQTLSGAIYAKSLLEIILDNIGNEELGIFTTYYYALYFFI